MEFGGWPTNVINLGSSLIFMSYTLCINFMNVRKIWQLLYKYRIFLEALVVIYIIFANLIYIQNIGVQLLRYEQLTAVYYEN